MAAPALYKLEPITDDPRFEGFGLVRNESLRGKAALAFDFGSDDVATKGRAWTVTPLSGIWKPQPVIGRVNAFNDYPCVALTIPAFSRRAVDALRDYLEPNGELLPLLSDVGEYYAYNITTVADILDLPDCDVIWMGHERTLVNIFDITRYVCFADKMDALSIFRLVERSIPFVSQLFVDRVQQHGLQGFNFVKLWPLPSGVSWRDDSRQQRKEHDVRTKRGRKAARGNTVVLMFPLAETKPSERERQKIAEYLNKIDALLYNPTVGKDSPYFGSLEGNDEVQGECRLFLSCPDADALIEKLRTWLTTLSWRRPVKVLKRYGEMQDADCREEYVEL